MGFSTMDSMIAQGLALGGIALVALFPTPGDFVDAVFPSSQTRVVSVEVVDDQMIELDVVTASEPQARTVAIPRLKSCDYDLDQLTTTILRDCRDDLVRRVLPPTGAVGIDPEAEIARLALVRLCQNQWAEIEDAEELLTHPECAASL